MSSFHRKYYSEYLYKQIDTSNTLQNVLDRTCTNGVDVGIILAYEGLCKDIHLALDLRNEERHGWRFPTNGKELVQNWFDGVDRHIDCIEGAHMSIGETQLGKAQMEECEKIQKILEYLLQCIDGVRPDERPPYRPQFYDRFETKKNVFEVLLGYSRYLNSLMEIFENNPNVNIEEIYWLLYESQEQYANKTTYCGEVALYLRINLLSLIGENFSRRPKSLSPIIEEKVEPPLITVDNDIPWWRRILYFLRLRVVSDER